MGEETTTNSISDCDGKFFETFCGHESRLLGLACWNGVHLILKGSSSISLNRIHVTIYVYLPTFHLPLNRCKSTVYVPISCTFEWLIFESDQSRKAYQFQGFGWIFLPFRGGGFDGEPL